MPLFPFQLPASDFIADPLHDLHVQVDASNRLVQQYKTTKTIAFVQALAAPAQDLEDALFQLYAMRALNTSTGAQLDELGEIVGQARQGFTDDIYRLFITSRIAINRSSGGPEEIYGVFATVLPGGITQALKYFQPAAFELTLTGALTTPFAKAFVQMLRQARAGGIGGVLRWSTLADTATFSFAAGNGLGFENGGFASAQR